MSYVVYRHTSPIGKVYIGITSQDPERRWRADGSGYRQNEKFYNAIKKYGWDKFTHEILFGGLSLDEARKIEKRLIEQYQSYRRGYNKTEGGDHDPLCDEAREKISDSVSKLWSDPDYRAHMSEAHKGKGVSGWKHTDAAKAKLSKIVIERCKNPEYRKKLSESAKKRMNSEYARQVAKRAWEKPESRQKIIDSKRGNHYRAKKVLCVETGKIYPSTKAAAEDVGVARETIGQVCRGKREMTHGCHWRFADE